MLSPLPRRSGWVDDFARYPSRVSLPRKGCRVGMRIVLFEACSAFTRVTACTLALSPIRDTLIEGFSHFVTSMTAPIASGWSVCRVGFAPTGKRRLCTAKTWFRFVNKIKYLADARNARQNIRANIFSSVSTKIDMQDYQSPVPVIDGSGGGGARDSSFPVRPSISGGFLQLVAPMPSTFDFCLPTMAAAV